MAWFDGFEAQVHEVNGQQIFARSGGVAGNLSAREVEILDYVARGLSNKEIARALRVAPETIKWHLKNIFEKLNVTSRIQAVRSGLALEASRTRPGGE